MSERVLIVCETLLDLRRGRWWAIDFAGAVEARVVPGAAVEKGYLLAIKWVVYANPDATPTDGVDRRRYVVGVQRNQGFKGAPREFLAWSVHPAGDGFFHVFDLGLRRREAVVPADTWTPVETSLWTNQEPTCGK